MATKPPGYAKFEKSAKDKEPRGMKEGSRKEMMMDRKQMGPAKKMARGKGC